MSSTPFVIEWGYSSLAEILTDRYSFLRDLPQEVFDLGDSGNAPNVFLPVHRLSLQLP